MSTLSQFTGGGGKSPVGSIVQAPYNLADPDYLPCDGRAVLRSQYPLLSACLSNIGTFTATARTKPAVPTSSAIAANGTSWVVTGSVGVSNLYTTPDGITYTARTTPAASDVRSILFDGVNFVTARNDAGGGGTGNPMYSTDGGTTWTVSASSAPVPLTALQTCMTHAPTLGTVGRFCMATSGGNFFTSDDRGVTWTSRAHGLGGSAFQVCWTGQKFIATTGTSSVIYTSADGIAWASQKVPFSVNPASANTGSIVSDGAGKVLWHVSTAQPFATSTDHGVTWSRRRVGSEDGSQATFNAAGTTPWCTNGRFFIASNSHQTVYSSSDLVAWVFDSGIIGANGTFGISHKSGVYLLNNFATTDGAQTIVEDTTKMTLPSGYQNVATSNGSWNNFMPFIKVK